MSKSLYQPDLIVIFIDDGDVADSVRETGVISPFLWQITERESGFAEMAPTSVYARSRFSRQAKQSAIVNYLRYNAKLALPGMRNAAIAQPSTDAVEAQASSSANNADDWRELAPAADYMVGQLCRDHPETPILFVSFSNYPGERYLPEETVRAHSPSDDALAVQSACEGRPQCYFLDLRHAFANDWAVNGHRFEAADGGHWNAYANRLVAETLAGFIEDHHLLGGPAG